MFIRLLIICLIIGVSFPSFAMEEIGAPPEPTLPVEVALTYEKKSNKSPDFEALAKKSPSYIKAPDFAKNVLLDKEKRALEDIYNSIDDKSGFVVFEDFHIKEIDRAGNSFSFKDFNENTNYTYDFNGETYAVFIRNIEDYQKLPLHKQTSFYIAGALVENTTIAAELILRPTFVDEKPFTLEDSSKAKLILSDIVDIKLIRYESGKVFYHDIATEWKPKSRIDGIIRNLNIKDSL